MPGTPKTIEAVYRVTTPMFCGGADQQAELRTPSFKGVLRFWWRALAWGRTQDADTLRKEEAALFGSSDENVGQAKFLMKLEAGNAPDPMPQNGQLKDGNNVVGEGARYLGYGVMEAFASRTKGTREGELTRKCVPAPFEFSVSILPKPAMNDQQKEQLIDALKLMGLVGGMGGKSRRGYGSLSLVTLLDDGKPLWHAPHVLNELSQELGRFRSGSSPAPEWTALSNSSRVILVSPSSRDGTPLALLDRIGRELVRFRSWGHNGRVMGKDSERNFTGDHDLMKQHWNDRRNHPRRIVFGLPHNYGKKPFEQVGPADAKLDRRASPLFIHIHQPYPDIPPVGVLTFLPSRFLPERRSDIDVGGKEIPLDGTTLWQPIHDFLKRMWGTSTFQRKEPFGEVREVTHD
ncbi:MAG: type III-B CRISPR module RAMP protein Cmr1 [Thermoguttaceae bacterium]